MSHHHHHTSNLSNAQILEAIRARITDAIPGAAVRVDGGGGHFQIAVTASQFQGMNTLKKQRLVYSAIKDLMTGDGAPVHAVDELQTLTP